MGTDLASPKMKSKNKKISSSKPNEQGSLLNLDDIVPTNRLNDASKWDFIKKNIGSFASLGSDEEDEVQMDETP